MDTNDEVRRRRLGGLIARTKDGLKGVAQRAGLSNAALDQLIKVTYLPEKKTGGPRSRKCMGDPVARALEQAYKLPAGWMDWPLEAVDYAIYDALPEPFKIEAQVRMMFEINKIMQREKLVNIHASKIVTNTPNQEPAQHNEQTESDSSAKNSDNAREKVRAVIDETRGSKNASNKHVRVPRKKGRGST